MESSTKPNRKRQRLSTFAKALLREWRRLQLPVADATVIIAISGGADSSALLFALDELINAGKLRIKMMGAHLNHRLRGKKSTDDALWIARVAKSLGYRVVTGKADIKRRAAQSRDNLEQAARIARYEFLKKAAKSSKAKVIVTGHTLDDQAETILLNLMRGSGSEGLMAMERVRAVDSSSEILLARPLLSWATHADTESYCIRRSIDFRVDEMNADESFARVRVRQQLIPLMKTFNPRIVEALSRTTEILREDNAALAAAARRVVELSVNSESRAHDIRIDLLKLAPPALRKRALRIWISANRGDLRRLERVHVEAIERLMFSGKSGRVIELPGGATITRTAGRLRYRQERLRRKT